MSAFSAVWGSDTLFPNYFGEDLLINNIVLWLWQDFRGKILQVELASHFNKPGGGRGGFRGGFRGRSGFRYFTGWCFIFLNAVKKIDFLLQYLALWWLLGWNTCCTCAVIRHTFGYYRCCVLMVLWPCVCLLILCWNSRTYWAGFWHRGFLRPVLRFMLYGNCSYPRLWTKNNVAMAYQQVLSAVDRWSRDHLPCMHPALYSMWWSWWTVSSLSDCIWELCYCPVYVAYY